MAAFICGNNTYMQSNEIISYIEMCNREGLSLQRDEFQCDEIAFCCAVLTSARRPVG